MDEIKSKRGQQEMAFRKLSDYFTVCLKRGWAASEASLEAGSGWSVSEVTHISLAISINSLRVVT